MMIVLKIPQECCHLIRTSCPGYNRLPNSFSFQLWGQVTWDVTTLSKPLHVKSRSQRSKGLFNLLQMNSYKNKEKCLKTFSLCDLWSSSIRMTRNISNKTETVFEWMTATWLDTLNSVFNPEKTYKWSKWPEIFQLRLKTIFNAWPRFDFLKNWVQC